MGYLNEISTVAKSVSSAKAYAANFKGNVSIARGALDGTMQFACLVSDSIPIDMAATVARTLERVYASFVQTYLSLNNTIDISVDKNPNMFLKRFHHNIKVESAYDKILGKSAEDVYFESCTEADDDYDALMERVYNGTTKAYINEAENQIIAFNFSDKFNKSVFEANQAQLEESLKYFDFTPIPNVGNSPFYEALDTDEINMHQIKQGINVAGNKEVEMLKLQNNDKIRVPAMTDNDVKKSNEMQPYLMQVRLMAVNDQNEFVQFMDFIVGVKVTLHNIRSEEMITNIQQVMQNNGKIFNFIRWTTGEKSLFKDLILNLNEVKLDVANRSRGSSPWWTTLKRLKETSRAQAAFFSRTQVVPNSTLVISSYEADVIQKNYGMNIRDPRFAKKLTQSLFLMNFVVLDEGTRTVDILYDGESAFQTYALETLEREVSMNSNKIGKELTRMISR
jgi:hypothetical protein